MIHALWSVLSLGELHHLGILSYQEGLKVMIVGMVDWHRDISVWCLHDLISLVADDSHRLGSELVQDLLWKRLWIHHGPEDLAISCPDRWSVYIKISFCSSAMLCGVMPALCWVRVRDCIFTIHVFHRGLGDRECENCR